MDFHLHQTQARNRTRHLVLLFCLAVALVMLGVNLMGAFIWGLVTPGFALPQYFVITNCAIVVLYVLGGAWLEWQRLLEGGASVAHRLGAETPNPYNLRHQRLLNIAEELAIAAGVPVPEVFTLDHDSINALTAGHEPAHCAIVVTRGAMEQLTRNELQAVLAHEVAHIVNGDVALNTRLTGALYGLFSLNLLGRAMLYAAFGRNRDQPSLMPWPLLIIGGVVLTSVGWIGAASARLVQAGISRQCEFLADAQAVQFTRDRDGLGRALRKIAGQSNGTGIASEYNDVVAHLWLASDSKSHGWLDTHPPLMTRIRRLHGRPLPPIRPSPVELEHESGPGKNVAPIIESLDWPGSVQLGQVAAFSSPAYSPSGSHLASPEPVQAPALPRQDSAIESQIHTVMDMANNHAVQADQLIQAVRDLGSNLSQTALLLNAIVAGPVSLSHEADQTDDQLHMALQWLEEPKAQWLRVPLIELLTSRIRHWPLECRNTLVRYCHDAVLADGRIEKTEWIYFTLVRHRLLPDAKVRREWASATQKRRALAEVFSMAGHLSEQSARRVRDAVVLAAEQLGVEQPTATPEQFEFRSLSRALDVLRAIAPLRKPLLLKSLQTLSQPQTNATYQAFLVAVAAAIDCPPLEPLVSVPKKSIKSSSNEDQPIG